MLKEETLHQTGQRQYEEPEGEFLEMIEKGSKTITVLTKIESDNGGGRGEDVSLPFDPSEFSVNTIKNQLTAESIPKDKLNALLEAEKNGKDRKTAKIAIENHL